ncbi:MAG: capsular biosynthesis protein [Candidatus Marinimicrobia bacterium]|nr:capsular biosynthesis protein [Candidatus Neomarinimicrobiota bacterium]|tara:strand:- start:1170 stop:1946 length:777 start_codon:yes stop_codon:yes gene_type:complete
MIDFHNHIIPNLDDGSKSIDMSINMLKEAQAQGITDIVNTIHYQHPKMERKNTSYKFIIDEINKFQEIAYNYNIKIHAASEVFFKFNLTEILDNPITTFGNGKFMLIEFQRLSFPIGYEDEIFKVQLKGINPIIAHPERYRGVQNNIDLARKWIDRGYLIQIDCASIIGGFGKETQITAIELLKNGLCHLIGSDAHNDKNRNFFLKKTLLETEKIIGNNSVSIIKNNSKKILNGEIPLSYSIENKKGSIFSKISSFFK